MISLLRAEGLTRPYRVLIPLLNQRLAADLLTIAQAMAARQNEGSGRGGAAEAIILGVAEVHDSSFSSARPLARAYRTLLNYMPPAQPRLHEGSATALNVYTRVTTAHSVAQGIIEAARESRADLIIISWKGYSHEPDHLYGRICDEVMRGAPCDVLLARIGAGGLAEVHEMLLAVRGGPYAEMALRVGQALMPELDATLAVMHAGARAAQPDAPAPWDEPFRDIEEELQGIAHRSLSGLDGLDAITEQLANHDLTIIGASGELHSVRMGGERSSATAALSQLACTLDKSLLVAKTHQPLELMRYQRPIAPPAGEFDVEPGAETGWSASVMRPIIERWSVENSYEVGEFADYARLAELKQRQGCRVSLCLLVEEQIHNLPAMLHGLQIAVQEQAPLVDEIVTLDGSADGTMTRTLRQQGFAAWRHDELLPEISTYVGHGCLLWKSAACTSGDLLVWLDLRAGRVISGSVAGLLGPLLEESGLAMVIGGASHRRDGEEQTLDWSLEAVAEGLRAGRSEAVAALCARFFPPLGGLTEPNSYDMAISRPTLERLPVVAGAWAAIGLLLAVIELEGLNGLGQVELARPPVEEGPRLRHKADGLLSLIGRYLHSGAYRSGRPRSVVLAEIAELHRLLNGGPLNPRRAAHEVELRELETWELPPLASLPQYLARRSNLENPTPTSQRLG